MLTKCLFESNAEPVTWYGQIVGIASRGYRQKLALTGAVVECRGEAVIAKVSIHLSVDERGRGSIAFRFTDAPRALRDSLREAAERYPAEPFVPFSIVDGARCDVPALPWQAIGSADEGPVPVTLYGEGLRGLVPWPVKAVAPDVADYACPDCGKDSRIDHEGME